MSGVGVTFLLAGIWFTYAGLKNVAPLQTLKAVIQKPQDARAIIDGGDYPLDPNTYGYNAGQQLNPNQVTSGIQAGAGNLVVAFARKQIGKPYQFGGTGNPGYDCSGLVQAALKEIGVDVPHSAAQQLASLKGKFVPASLKDLSQLQPGDIIFPDYVGDHVGIYAGNGMIIHAPKPGSKVAEIPVWAVARAKRFTPVITVNGI